MSLTLRGDGVQPSLTLRDGERISSLTSQPSVYEGQSFYIQSNLSSGSSVPNRNILVEKKEDASVVPTEHIIYTIPIKIHWNVALCDCCASSSKDSLSDTKKIYTNCITGFFCPCCLFSDLASGLDSDSSKWNCVKCCFCCCCIRAGYRRRVRRRFNLPSTPCNDCCVICCCPCCSLVQEVNEIETEHLYPRHEIMKI